MQTDTHWILKDFLTFMTIVGVFYNMQEGRNSNLTLQKILLSIENWFDRASTGIAQSSDMQLITQIQGLSKRGFFISLAILTILSITHLNTPSFSRYSAISTLIFLTIFFICNQIISNKKYLDWTPVKLGLLVGASTIFIFLLPESSNSTSAHTIHQLTSKILFAFKIKTENTHTSLIAGIILALAMIIYGIVITFAGAISIFICRTIMAAILKLTRGITTLLNWIDPNRKFAWFMFFICASAQIISNHL